MYCDGASIKEGEEWKGSVGFVIEADNGEVIAEDGFEIGNATCNEAEFSALFWGLKKALEFEVRTITVFMDSQLTVNCLSGKWKVRKEELKVIAKEIWPVMEKFDRVELKWIPREQNERADEWTQRAFE